MTNSDTERLSALLSYIIHLGEVVVRQAINSDKIRRVLMVSTETFVSTLKGNDVVLVNMIKVT